MAKRITGSKKARSRRQPSSGLNRTKLRLSGSVSEQTVLGRSCYKIDSVVGRITVTSCHIQQPDTRYIAAPAQIPDRLVLAGFFSCNANSGDSRDNLPGLCTPRLKVSRIHQLGWEMRTLQTLQNHLPVEPVDFAKMQRLQWPMSTGFAVKLRQPQITAPTPKWAARAIGGAVNNAVLCSSVLLLRLASNFR